MQTQGSLLGLSALPIAVLPHWNTCCLVTAHEWCFSLCIGEVGFWMMSVPALKWLSSQASGLKKPSVRDTQSSLNPDRQQLDPPTSAAWGQDTSSFCFAWQQVRLMLHTACMEEKCMFPFWLSAWCVVKVTFTRGHAVAFVNAGKTWNRQAVAWQG